MLFEDIRILNDAETGAHLAAKMTDHLVPDARREAARAVYDAFLGLAKTARATMPVDGTRSGELLATSLRRHQNPAFDRHRRALGGYFPASLADYFASRIAEAAEHKASGGTAVYETRRYYPCSHLLGYRGEIVTPRDLIDDPYTQRLDIVDRLTAAERDRACGAVYALLDRFHDSYRQQNDEVLEHYGLGLGKWMKRVSKGDFANLGRQQALRRGHANHLFVRDAAQKELQEVLSPWEAERVTDRLWNMCYDVFSLFHSCDLTTAPQMTFDPHVAPASYASTALRMGPVVPLVRASTMDRSR